jgi:hypothetical protein
MKEMFNQLSTKQCLNFSLFYMGFFRHRQIERKMFVIKNICSTFQIILHKQQISNKEIYIFFSFATHPRAVVKLHLAVQTLWLSSIDPTSKAACLSCPPPCYFSSTTSLSYTLNINKPASAYIERWYEQNIKPFQS